MGRIQILDAHVVNQIAAGEVVERPASVVRELLDNAIDAGARRIEVEVGEGGLAFIEVADDGCGMDADDLARVFLPHATSKIRSAADLQHIATLGFRGEALASIGSVSRAVAISRPHDAEQGHRIVAEDGRLGAVEPSAASPGTVVRAEGLFRHVPARRKFLRSAGTELAHVRECVLKFTLAFPEVAFRLSQAGRVLVEAPAGEARRARLARVVEADVARDLIHVAGDDGMLALDAWIGTPALARRDGRHEQIYLGGRFVRDRNVAHAVREAYRDLLPPGPSRPVAFVFLSAPAEAVDVNVHPQKSEVRWRDPGAVHRLVQHSLRQALEAGPDARTVSLPGNAPARRHAAVEHAFLFAAPSPRLAVLARERMDPAWGELPGSATRADERGHEAHAPERRSDVCAAAAHAPLAATLDLRPIGQALGTYLVLETRDAIVLVDQHALHERVLFDRLNARLREAGRLEVQHLLVPKVAHLGAAASSRLLEFRSELAALGWEIEPFGEDALAVHGVPAVLKRPHPEAVLNDMLAMLESQKPGELDRTTFVGEAIDRLACRAAVMAGDRLHDEEILALLEQAERLDHDHTCPHGRPTRLVLARKDLERWFHRTE